MSEPTEPAPLVVKDGNITREGHSVIGAVYVYATNRTEPIGDLVPAYAVAAVPFGTLAFTGDKHKAALVANALAIELGTVALVLPSAE